MARRVKVKDTAAEQSADELEYFIRQFDESVDQTHTARANSEIWRDYYDGKQWTDAERSVLTSRGQPCITDNRIKDKVEYLLGMERQTRTDPKAYPRTPQDEGAAEAATDALRYVADCNNFPQVKSKVFETMLIEGYGGCEVIVENKGNTPKIVQRFIRWDRLYYDPHSLSPDFSDAEYMGIVVWMDLSRAKKKYPGLADAFDGLMRLGGVGETYDDKPMRWVDRTRQRVQILEHYYRAGGEWKRVVFSRVGIIEGPAVSQYVDEYGEPQCPLILQSAYLDRDGNRYGVVSRYKDLQDEINKRRSKALHLLSARTVIAESGAVEDRERARKEVAKPDGYVEVTPGMRFDIEANSDLANGQFQLLQEAANSLAVTGPNAALQGQTGQVSGRAKQIDQNAGVVQLGVLFDGIRFWQKRVMQATWHRVKQFWTAEMWVRVTDDERTRFIPLNRRTTVGELEAEKLRDAEMPDEQKIAALQGMAADPAMMQPTVQNDVTQMDVDIIIDEAPDVVTVQQEQWATLVELAKGGVPVPPKALIEASSLPTQKKEQMLEEMEKASGGIPPQVQQELQAFTEDLQKKAAELQTKEQEIAAAESSLTAQSSDLKVQVANLKVMEADLRAQRAELDAYKAELAAMQKVIQSQLSQPVASEPPPQ